MGRTRVDPAELEIRLLTDGDDISAFTCGDADLDGFLKEDAARLQRLHVVRAYLAFHQGEVAGYVAVLNDAVVLKTPDKKKLSLRHDDHPAVPGVKVARLAVATRFREFHIGLGTVLIRFAFDLARVHAVEMGCRLLTVDAYRTSMGFYEKLGFVQNKRNRDAAGGEGESDTIVHG